jgi:hypothetical protein
VAHLADLFALVERPAIIRPAPGLIRDAYGFSPGLITPRRVRTISQFSFVSANTASMSFPAGIKKGDVAVFYDMPRGSTTAPGTITGDIPAGFTEAHDLGVSDGNGFQRTNISWKLLDGTEAGAFASLITTSEQNKALQILRGDAPIRAVTMSAARGQQATTADPTAQVVAVSGIREPMALIATLNAGTQNSNFTTFSPRAATGSATVGNAWRRASWIFYGRDEVRADQTVDMADTGASNVLTSFYLTFR